MNIPTSAIPWLIGSFAFLLFGFRGATNYRKLHSPLSLFFSMSGFSASLAFFFYSVPLMFTSDQGILLAVNIIGDFFLYVMFVYQVVILHYLVFKNKMPLNILLIPVILVASIGWLSHCYGYIVNGVSLVNGVFEYQLPLIANIIQALFLMVVFIVGIFMLLRIRQQSDYRARLGLLGIGILYILSGLGGSLNVILSGESNNSPAIIASYIVGFTLFIFVLITARILNPQRKR